jgi:hypothetical protein
MEATVGPQAAPPSLFKLPLPLTERVAVGRRTCRQRPPTRGPRCQRGWPWHLPAASTHWRVRLAEAEARRRGGPASRGRPASWSRCAQGAVVDRPLSGPWPLSASHRQCQRHPLAREHPSRSTIDPSPLPAGLWISHAGSATVASCVGGVIRPTGSLGGRCRPGPKLPHMVIVPVPTKLRLIEYIPS